MEFGRERYIQHAQKNEELYGSPDPPTLTPHKNKNKAYIPPPEIAQLEILQD